LQELIAKLTACSKLKTRFTSIASKNLRMRIIHVQKVKGIAGSEKSFLNLLPDLVINSVSVALICFYEKRHKSAVMSFVGQLKTLNIEVEAIELSPIFSFFIAAKYIKKRAIEWKADAIHSHLIHADFWCACASYLGLKLPVFSTKHGYDEKHLAQNGFNTSHFPYFNLYWQIARFSEKKIKSSYAVSKGLSIFYKHANIRKGDEMEVIYHGVDSTEKQAVMPNFKFGAPQLIIVGRLVAFKGHEFVFKHLSEIKAKYPTFSLVVLGEGETENELKAIVKLQKCEENVHFLGYQPNILEYLAASDLKLMPSIAEGFGLVNLEAMNQALAIIGFDSPSSNEIIIHQETGILVPPGNGAAFSSAIVELLSNPEQMKQMGKAGKQRLETFFSRIYMVKKVIAFYEKNI
jgi:glycosyltransferase involved in cell wall biosynthesis